MSAVEVTDVARRPEDLEVASGEALDAPPQPASAKGRNVRWRYALLIGIALLSTWLIFAIQNSLAEVNAELEMIRAKVASPIR